MKVIGFNKKNLIALAIAVVLAATSFGVYQAQAAGKVDTDADVTITANVSEQEAFYKNYSKYTSAEDEDQYNIKIDLYKLASVDESGQIGNCNLTGVDLTALSANKVTVADVKSKIVNPAVTAVAGKDADETITVDMTTKTGSVTIKKGAGVYLYVPQNVQDKRYTYKFTPYIIMVPNSDYITATGTEEDEDGNVIEYATGADDDEWSYTATFNLKAEAEQRYGSLRIDKTLSNYNQSLGTASFIYEIEAKYDNDVVYSNVVSLDFTKPGTASSVELKIPAATTVKVTEVETGASYEATIPTTTEKTVERKIKANKVAVAEFTNQYDNELQVGGISVINKFEKNDDGIFEYKGNNDISPIVEGGTR